MPTHRRTRRPVLLALVAAAVAAALSAGLSAGLASAAGGAGTSLPLGDADLLESRTTTAVAPGLTLTTITRGDEPAAEDEIPTTSRGPWQVQVLTLDPRRARADLAATFGPDLARTETTTELARLSGALAAVNAGFFTFTASTVSPGDPVGTGVYGGRLLSEPVDGADRRTLVVRQGGREVDVESWTWSRSVRDRRTGQTTQVEWLNHTPMVPTSCLALADPTACEAEGDTVAIGPEFGASTPAGPGVEVVQDRRGCAVSVTRTRGTTLAPGQTSLQATGSDARRLLAAASGCTRTEQALTDEDGDAVRLGRGTYAVNGRPHLLEDGRIVAPEVVDSFNARNPRTLVGTTRDGRVLLVTIDGRQATSVGTTITETARVAKSLGLRDALNLDGGGSTSMVVGGRLVNTPSGSAERPVGDALVVTPRP